MADVGNSVAFSNKTQVIISRNLRAFTRFWMVAYFPCGIQRGLSLYMRGINGNDGLFFDDSLFEIDFIPDIIPILGYLDDVIIVPLGIMLALKMLPTSVIKDCTEKAEELLKKGKPKNWIVGSIIILIWGLILIWGGITVYRLLS